jgi:hypothetical protein
MLVGIICSSGGLGEHRIVECSTVVPKVGRAPLGGARGVQRKKIDGICI